MIGTNKPSNLIFKRLTIAECCIAIEYWNRSDKFLKVADVFLSFRPFVTLTQSILTDSLSLRFSKSFRDFAPVRYVHALFLKWVLNLELTQSWRFFCWSMIISSLISLYVFSLSFSSLILLSLSPSFLTFLSRVRWNWGCLSIRIMQETKNRIKSLKRSRTSLPHRFFTISIHWRISIENQDKRPAIRVDQNTTSCSSRIFSAL